MKYQIPEAGRVTLKIYNLLGKEIRTLVDKVQAAGIYEVRWDGKDNTGRTVASGIYLNRIQVGDFVEVKKLTLLK
ncbi:MAG: FlgD immunoglobulin-like domain containing protein [bacterium]